MSGKRAKQNRKHTAPAVVTVPAEDRLVVSWKSVWLQGEAKDLLHALDTLDLDNESLVPPLVFEATLARVKANPNFQLHRSRVLVSTNVQNRGDFFSCLICRSFEVVIPHPIRQSRVTHYGFGCPRCGIPQARRYREFRALQDHIQGDVAVQPRAVKERESYVEYRRKTILASIENAWQDMVAVALKRIQEWLPRFSDTYKVTVGHLLFCFQCKNAAYVVAPDSASTPPYKLWLVQSCAFCGQIDTPEHRGFLDTITKPRLRVWLEAMVLHPREPDFDAIFPEEARLAQKELHTVGEKKERLAEMLAEVIEAEKARIGSHPQAAFLCFLCDGLVAQAEEDGYFGGPKLHSGFGCVGCGYTGGSTWQAYLAENPHCTEDVANGYYSKALSTLYRQMLSELKGLALPPALTPGTFQPTDAPQLTWLPEAL